jgi:hypothetical protein
LAVINPFGYKPIGECDEKQDEEKNTTCLVVEKPANNHQEDVSHMQSCARWLS